MCLICSTYWEIWALQAPPVTAEKRRANQKAFTYSLYETLLSLNLNVFVRNIVIVESHWVPSNTVSWGRNMHWCSEPQWGALWLAGRSGIIAEVRPITAEHIWSWLQVTSMTRRMTQWHPPWESRRAEARTRKGVRERERDYEGGGVERGAEGRRGKRKNIWFGLYICGEDSCVCWRLPVVFFRRGCCAPLWRKWRQHVCDGLSAPEVASLTPLLPLLRSLTIY